LSGVVAPLRARAPEYRDVAPALIGGALVCTGAALPWLSLFAGLQSYSGLVGLYGRVLFASGLVAAAGGVAMLVRRERWLRPVVGAVGVAQTLFVVWLVIGLRATTRELGGMHAMLVARPGPGLFVALAGAILIASALWLRASSAPSALGADPRMSASGKAAGATARGDASW
jgi:hypothetical protein